MKEIKTCESCKFYKSLKNDCTNSEVHTKIDLRRIMSPKDFGCIFWVVDSKKFYANGVPMKNDGMTPHQAEKFLNGKDPAPSPVKQKTNWPPRMTTFKERK